MKRTAVADAVITGGAVPETSGDHQNHTVRRTVTGGVVGGLVGAGAGAVLGGLICGVAGAIVGGLVRRSRRPCGGGRGNF